MVNVAGSWFLPKLDGPRPSVREEAAAALGNLVFFNDETNAGNQARSNVILKPRDSVHNFVAWVRFVFKCDYQ